jgi:hypothetical protein
MLRLPKARELGKPYFDFMRYFHEMALHQQRYVGLYPWPESIE